MKNNQEHHFYELSNGVRIIHKNSNTPVIHLGLFINAGSRDEKKEEQGMAHFIEHVIFKGTQKRKSYQIFNSIENVGGDLNAYTAKEETCIHCSVPAEYFEKAAEIIADVAFHSIFPDKELEKEKDIIIDEYYYFKDIPEETIMDDFDELVFGNHPLGYNILGHPERIRQFSKKDIDAFMQANYHPSKMVVSVVGNVPEKNVYRIIKKYFDFRQTLQLKARARRKFSAYLPVKKAFKKKIFQSHCIMGTPAYSTFDKHKTALILLNNLLGGPASNSLLNMAVREKHGLTYNIESNYSAFTDTGLFRIYVSADNDSMEKTTEIIDKILKSLRGKKLGTLQLARAKQQLLGNLCLALENKTAEMLSMGKAFLIFNKVDTVETISRKIENITDMELLEIANEILCPACFCELKYLSDESYRG